MLNDKQIKVFVETCRGISQETWDNMTKQEKWEYYQENPNTIYIKTLDNLISIIPDELKGENEKYKSFILQEKNENYPTEQEIINQFIIDNQDNPEKIDKFKQILKNISASMNEKTTFEKYDGKNGYTKERQELHEHIINSYLDKSIKAIKKKGKPSLIVLAGKSGAGKSTFLSKNNFSNYLLIDNDDIKDKFKDDGYSGMNTFLYQKECNDIINELITRAIRLNMNIIYATTLSDLNIFEKSIEPIKKAKYKLDLCFFYITGKESIKRSIERGLKPNGRFVPLKIFTCKRQNLNNFNKIKKEYNNWVVFDSSNNKIVAFDKK